MIVLNNKFISVGFDYFGASPDSCTGYDSDLSIWLSVDPMADEYPSMSPYMYTAGNPVMLVDPDGRWVKGAGFWRNIFKTDHRIKAENIERKHTGATKTRTETGWRVSWEEGEQYVNEDGTYTKLKTWAFVDIDKKKSKSFSDRVRNFDRVIHNSLVNFLKPLDRIPTGEGSALHTAAKVVANINPLISLSSASKIFLGDGKDIYGVEADNGDKALAILDVVTLGSSKTIKLLPNSVVSKSAKQMSKSVSEINGIVIDLVQGVKTSAESKKK